MITKPVFSNGKAIKAGQVIKENAHRYKQDIEKDYIYQQFINKEKNNMSIAERITDFCVKNVKNLNNQFYLKKKK